MLNLLHRISYGSFTPYLPVVTSDITRKEFHIFLPLVFFIILFGVYPQFIMNDILYPALTMLHLSQPNVKFLKVIKRCFLFISFIWP